MSKMYVKNFSHINIYMKKKKKIYMYSFVIFLNLNLI